MATAMLGRCLSPRVIISRMLLRGAHKPSPSFRVRFSPRCEYSEFAEEEPPMLAFETTGTSVLEKKPKNFFPKKGQDRITKKQQGFAEMEFSYGTKKWKSKGVFVTPKEEDESASGRTVEFALGLHAPRRFDKIMPIHNCLLQHDVSNQVLKLVQEHGERNVEEMPPYSIRTHDGFLKHLTIRSGSWSLWMQAGSDGIAHWIRLQTTVWATV